MTVDPLTDDATVPALIDRIVAGAPRSVAVRAGDTTLTYAELSERAERVARRLRQLGVRPGDLVGQCLERSASLVVAALATFKVGAAYVAIDPAYPDERLRWMLDDSGVAALITDERNAPRLDVDGERPAVVLGAGGELRDVDDHSAFDTDTLPPAPSASAVAYVVYTSGSTGRPKGVLVEHGSLSNLVEWHRGAFSLDATDRCTQIASPGFDASVWEIWPALASGAAIHVVPEELRGDPLGLRDWLVTEGISVTFLPTVVAEAVIGLAWPADGPLRFLLTGGDALARRPEAGLPFAVVNNYGLSETAVVATSGVVDPAADGPPSIGRAIAGIELEIVDEDLRPVAPGVAGELIVGGVAVARGYLNRPELTAERFIEDARGRRYRTGDRVRRTPDGEIEFLGRLDEQLSIRGFRVEPGEIAAALNSHPAIEASVVVGAGGSGAARQLAAYLVATGDGLPDHDELSAFLGAFLPEHMLPASYQWLDELPLTHHGKIDRDALPAPSGAGGRGAGGSEAEHTVEGAITSIIAELLGVEEIQPDENFFLLGGHSMLGAQLIVRIEDLFGVEITLRYLFDHPTPAAIAAEVERQAASERAGDLVAG